MRPTDDGWDPPDEIDEDQAERDREQELREENRWKEERHGR